MRRWITLAVALTLVGVVATGGLAQEAKRGGTLQVVMPWGTMVYNGNPFLPGGQNMPATMATIYEGLYYINETNGQERPRLGVSYQWSADNLRLTVKTRQGVLWSDGKPFSAKDVAFTFNYIKQHPAADLAAVWKGGLERVETTDDHTVVFTFSSPNTPLWYYLAMVPIVPEHVWSKVDDPMSFTNREPVGTGPFVLKSFTPQSMTVVRNPRYWMEGRPYIDAITYRAVDSNTTVLLMMLRNEADVTYTFFPDPAKSFAARDPAVHKFWWPVNNTNILYLNTAKEPFNDSRFRKAVAMALDRQAMAERAYYGVVKPAHPTGIVPGQVGQWIDPSLEKQAFQYDPAGARQLLQQAGFRWNSAGDLLGPDGKKLPALRILVGSGWTDFITMAQIISQNLAAIGIETVIDQQPWNSYITSLMSGTYDMAISWGSGTGPTPYYLYYMEFSPEFSGAKIGDTATSNWARFTDPAITEALARYRRTSDRSQQKQAIETIAGIVLDKVPFIPLTERTNFLDYNESRFTGWPSADDPYNGGDPPDGIGAVWMFLNVHLK
ncbi:ABC transporter substrate-binding protein [Carboxydochorda subterranea]|uniref:ABC transporter substrate-binding protein n=1 Tax=Carboxydichorda subterranea TaxID=3109565 RepID=A0ABZ1BZ94_9FIRM|nr:ABC transporter substrate-binding protein [Limnochorda sp. L945t]WRP18144.1 ABC transporter substrate-binding protein [Limnochorda sp. L945t]